MGKLVVMNVVRRIDGDLDKKADKKFQMKIYLHLIASSHMAS